MTSRFDMLFLLFYYLKLINGGLVIASLQYQLVNVFPTLTAEDESWS